MEHEEDGDTNCIKKARNNSQMFGKCAGRVRNRRTSWDHRNYGIVEIDQNTEKNPGDLRRLAIIQTLVKTIS